MSREPRLDCCRSVVRPCAIVGKQEPQQYRAEHNHHEQHCQSPNKNQCGGRGRRSEHVESYDAGVVNNIRNSTYEQVGSTYLG